MTSSGCCQLLSRGILILHAHICTLNICQNGMYHSEGLMGVNYRRDLTTYSIPFHQVKFTLGAFLRTCSPQPVQERKIDGVLKQVPNSLSVLTRKQCQVACGEIRRIWTLVMAVLFSEEHKHLAYYCQPNTKRLLPISYLNKLTLFSEILFLLMHCIITK